MSGEGPFEPVPPINRADFILALSNAVAGARDELSNLGILLIDITNLSRINRNHSYQTGDLILASAYGQLLSVSKLPNSVFRVGDHRFAFILQGLSNPAFIALAINRVQRLLEQELFIDADMIGAELKIGIAINREGRRDPMAMLALAESSLAYMKLGGSHRLEEYIGDESDEPVDYQLERRFLQALQDNEFELYFQPKVHLATGRVNNAEALLRWFPQGMDAVSPEMVVELADSMGRSFELTKWVVHRGLSHVRDWQDSLAIRVALNIQPSLVSNPDLPSLLHDAIAIWSVDPDKVTIEITESGIIEDVNTGFENLLRLRDLGLNLSIDDFGTGYSSLSYFKQIPAKELKIDRSFVSSMMADEQDLELVKIMIQIAHQFDMAVVAEGVEDREALDKLRELGCDYGQGYYFCKPLAPDEFEQWVAQWPGLQAQ